MNAPIKFTDRWQELWELLLDILEEVRIDHVRTDERRVKTLEKRCAMVQNSPKLSHQNESNISSTGANKRAQWRARAKQEKWTS